MALAGSLYAHSGRPDPQMGSSWSWPVPDLLEMEMQSSLLPSPLVLQSWNPSCKLVLSNCPLPPPFSRETMGRAAGLTFDLPLGTTSLTSQESLGDLVLVPSRKCLMVQCDTAASFLPQSRCPTAPQDVFSCSPETVPQWRRCLLSMAAGRVQPSLLSG